MDRTFARIAVVNTSLIKLSLLAYSWAEYRKQTRGGQFDQMVAAIDISQSAYAVFFR